MFTINDLIEVFGEQNVSGGSTYTEINNVEHDTRRLRPGSLYVAIKGEKLDGHDFIEEAVNKGAVACIVEKPISGLNVIQILVQDSVKAYGDLAAYWRSKLKYPIVAVTGSNGKTTTKDMLYGVLSFKNKAVRTDGNFNNLIGVPYTILSFPLDADYGIVEMGMNSKGEIKRLAQISRPNIGLITNIGRAHIGLLGSIEAIFGAKMELFDEVIKNKGRLCVNLSDPMLSKWFHSKKVPVQCFTYSFVQDNDVDLRVSPLGFKDGSEHFELIFGGKGPYSGSIPVMGTYNVYNACSAIAVGLMFGLDMNDCIQGVRDFKGSKLRSSIVEKDGVIYFVDCYNANPDSMKASISSAVTYNNGGKKIAVLGDMLELERLSWELHEEIGAFVASKGLDLVFVYGNYAKAYAGGFIKAGGSSDKILMYEFGDMVKMRDAIKKTVKKDDMVVVKGSRGMKLEDIFQD